MKIPLWRYLPFLLSAAVPLTAQYMNDTSTHYSGMWFDFDNVYVYGSTAGAMSIHQYRVEITIETPSGGTTTAVPGYSGGSVWNQAGLNWDPNDCASDFIGRVIHRAFCTVSYVTPVLLFAQLRKRPQQPTVECTTGTANACGDGNSLVPIGPKIRHTCEASNYCCDQNNKFVRGYCRVEICEKRGEQTTEPKPSVCYGSLNTCRFEGTALCAPN